MQLFITRALGRGLRSYSLRALSVSNHFYFVPTRKVGTEVWKQVGSSDVSGTFEGVHYLSVQSSTSKATVRFFSIRRRRGGGGSSAEYTRPGGVDDAISKAPMTSVEFGKKAEAVLEKLENSMLHMKDCNDVFKITRTRRNDVEGATLEITLAPPHGTFFVSVDESYQELSFNSPVSGPKIYVWSKATDDFVNADDGHVFIGLFVRDLIRHCNGVPKGL